MRALRFRLFWALGFRVEDVGALRFMLSFVLGFRGLGGFGFRVEALSLRVFRA